MVVVEHNGTDANNVDAIVRRMVATLLWPVNIPLWRLMCVLINCSPAPTTQQHIPILGKWKTRQEVFYFLRFSSF